MTVQDEIRLLQTHFPEFLQISTVKDEFVNAFNGNSSNLNAKKDELINLLESKRELIKEFEDSLKYTAEKAHYVIKAIKNAHLPEGIEIDMKIIEKAIMKLNEKLVHGGWFKKPRLLQLNDKILQELKRDNMERAKRINRSRDTVRPVHNHPQG